MLHLLLFGLNFLGMLCLLLSSQRQYKLFVAYFPSLANLKQRKRSQNLGLMLIGFGFLVGVCSALPHYYVVAWFGWLSFSAIILYLWVLKFDNQQKQNLSK